MATPSSFEMSALPAYPHSMLLSPHEASEAYRADMRPDPSFIADSSSRTHLITPLEGGEGDNLQSHPLQPAQDVRSTEPYQRSLELRYWVWEAINAVLLIAMIVAVVVTLRLHDGQPAPQWPLSITINALVSIYAFVFKASMAFLLSSCISQFQWSWYRSPRPLGDLALYANAERGPMGSFLWLCSHHFRQPAVTMAAIITIAGIAIDPFFQQLVQSQTCSAPVLGGDQPSISRTNYLEVQDLPDTLQPAVISGFYQAQNLSDVNCSTGNCTFSTQYDTLGFCSQCDDVSDDVIIEETCLVENFDSDTIKAGACDVSSVDNLTVSYNITTTSGPLSANFYYHTYNLTTVKGLYQFDSPTVFSALGEWRNVEVMPYNVSTTVHQGVHVGVIFPKADTAVYGKEPADWDKDLTGCSDAQTNNTWYCRGYGAASCLLQPCVRTYTASVDAGQVVEAMVDRSDPALVWGYAEVAHNTTDGGIVVAKDIWGLVDKTCINDDEHQQLAAAGYELSGDKRWLGYNITFDPAGMSSDDGLTFPGSLLTHKCLYLIDANFVNNLWTQLLGNALLGNVQRDESSQKHSTTLNNVNLFTGPQEMLYLFNSGNINMTGIDSVYNNLAQALTLWVRANGQADFSERAVGEAFQFVSCTEVNWPWLALPAALALLTLMVLVLAVATTAWQGLPGWKASPLAFLFHTPAGPDWIDVSLVAPARRQDKSYDLGTETGMKKLANRIWVALSYENEGPRLRQVGARTKGF
ncbi:hypothetical protein E8E14_006122 [Neopestalotiopsis sp. 37M]|nr:hypothetical protein E8E14_006122 [Neopestalotiopsis sp. 37M]